VIEKKIFFNGLNELRAFAALAVIFHHIELFKSRDHLSSLFDSSFFSYFIGTVGKNGVHLFFVLSGFLITYLLLKEKEKHQTILFKKFFLRRIFRIWPLYYLIVLIGFLLIPFLAHNFTIFERVPYYYELISNPENYSFNAILLYLLILPNIALSYDFLIAGCSQAWSIGVEEQFYILWPLLIFVFSRRIIVWVFTILLLFFIFSYAFIQPDSFHLLSKDATFAEMLLPRIYALIKIFPFEFMTIGAIGGYLYAYDKEKVNDFLKSKFIYVSVVVFVFAFLFFSLFIPYFQSIILGFLFLFLILITISEENSIVFRNKPLSYLGKISYGIYMYHPFVMFLIFPFANTYFKDNDSTLYYNLFVYSFVFCITILLSHFSYKYFESVFIKIKDIKYKSL
jgi:peptidoglycan/LPS O-acetylase OafA/YrhL